MIHTAIEETALGRQGLATKTGSKEDSIRDV